MKIIAKTRKILCALLTVVLLVSGFTVTVAAETPAETSPVASVHLQKEIAFLEDLYGDESGTGVRVLSDWIDAQTADFYAGDMTTLDVEDLPGAVEMLRYTIPLVFECALSPEFGESSAAVYRSQVCFDDLAKMIETAEEKNADKMTQVILEIYPDFVGAFGNAFGDGDPTSVKNLGFFYASARKKLAADIADDGEEATFMNDVERDKAALATFYANFPGAGKTGLALFPQALLSELAEKAVNAALDRLKCLVRSPILFDGLAKCVEAISESETDEILLQFAEIVPDVQSCIQKAFDEGDGETPAADVFNETLFRVGLVCSDSHGHSFGAPVYLYNADRTECTAIAFCECGASVTETVELQKEGDKLIAAFENDKFETQSIDAEEEPAPQPKDDPSEDEPEPQPKEDDPSEDEPDDGEKDPVNGLTVTLIVLTAVGFAAAATFAVLFFRGKKKNP